MNIIVYTKDGCPSCRDVLDLLSKKGMAFEERDVGLNTAYLAELSKLSGQTRTPSVYIDEEIIPNTDRDEVEAYLRQMGALK